MCHVTLIEDQWYTYWWRGVGKYIDIIPMSFLVDYGILKDGRSLLGDCVFWWVGVGDVRKVVDIGKKEDENFQSASS